MKDSIVLQILALVFVGTLLVSCNSTKIGYAETSVLMSQFSESIVAQKKFEELKTTWDNNIKQINDSLVSTMNYLKQNYEKASNSEKEEMRSRLDRWNNDLNRYKTSVEKQAKEKEQELMAPIINKINSFLKIWGEQNGYDLILGTMQGGNILHANSKLNVTAQILKELNEHYKDLPGGEESKKSTDSTILIPDTNSTKN